MFDATRAAAKRCRRIAFIALSLSALALAACATRSQPDHAVWMKLLRWASGESSATAVKTTMMGPHLQVSVHSERSPGDDAQAEAVLAGARAAMRYGDPKTAERDGYRAFAVTGQMGEEIHYTNFWRASSEKGGLDFERPGSLLYRRTAAGLKVVGVMYTASPTPRPANCTAACP